MEKKTTSERLRLLMSERGLRQVDIVNLCRPICEKFGTTLGSNHISQYVNGRTEPGNDKLKILSLALDVSELWLMGFDVPQEPATSSEEPDAWLLPAYRSAPKEIRSIVDTALGPYREASSIAEKAI